MGKLAVIERAEADTQRAWAERLQEAISLLPSGEREATGATWRRLQDNTPGHLLIPSLSQREAGGTLLTWRKGSHHFDVEVEANGSLDFFYFDLDTDAAWDIETTLTADVWPEPVLRVLNLFRLA